jgi:hypothetical protein
MAAFVVRCCRALNPSPSEQGIEPWFATGSGQMAAKPEDSELAADPSSRRESTPQRLQIRPGARLIPPLQMKVKVVVADVGAGASSEPVRVIAEPKRRVWG